VRRPLIAALVSFAERSLQPDARRFLAGLSHDELQFIADYVSGLPLGPRPGSAEDRELKLIVLREYLCRSGARARARRAGAASN
jgi:hypothetical protein